MCLFLDLQLDYMLVKSVIKMSVEENSSVQLSLVENGNVYKPKVHKKQLRKCENMKLEE